VERILIVEDDRIALRNVSQFLSGEGYQVQRANNGDEALKLLEKEKFDLVLSDVIMPGTDGDRLLAHVRSRFADYPDNFNEWKPYFGTVCNILSGSQRLGSQTNRSRKVARED